MYERIIGIEFNDLPLKDAGQVFEEIKNNLPTDVYVVGYYKPCFEIKEISPKDTIIYLNGESYSLEKIQKILKESDYK